MSEHNNGVADAPVENTAGEQTGNDVQPSNAAGNDDMVAYETYKRKVDNEFRLKKRIEELEASQAQAETEKLEAAGKKDELIENLKSQLSTEMQKRKSLAESFAVSSIRKQIESEANKLGAVDSANLVRLLDLTKLDVDLDTFQANPEQVKMVLDDAKKEMPYMFSKTAPNLESHVPRGTQPDTKAPKTAQEKIDELAKLTPAELAQLAMERGLK